jgi:type I restriction-modification system DNA methylase subunit
MAQVERQQAVLALLQNLRDLDGLKKLFWEELNYERENKPLSPRQWSDSVRQVLAEDPVLFASGGEGNAFHVIYCRLASSELKRGFERPVVSQLLRDHPYALFVFSNQSQSAWHFLNVKFDEQAERRRLFRRITVRPGAGLRTATERVQLLDLAGIHPELFGISPLTIQQRCDVAFDVEAVTKDFFREIANWYFWALKNVRFPKDAPKEADGHDHISVIRLITRLIFCWFVKEKGLIPDTLFDERKLAETLNGFEPAKTSAKESVFYKAILQNLFFATLNTEMDKRGWTKEEQNFMAHSLYRHRECFREPKSALDLFKEIPFLNGGLFECLDKDLGENAKPRYVRIDGFSRRADSQPVVPDFLFFGGEREVDLSADYGDKKFQKVRVRGLIETLQRYHFTIEENTPIEQEVALDPELSGKVFENLLAAYNPETGATARKQTGSFYTPREIVNYMVDEALIACLKTKLEAALAHGGPRSVVADSPKADATERVPPNFEARLRHLFVYSDEPHQFTPSEVDALIAAIDGLKSLDPAVGSGAFPMGILHKLVFILGKLDPRNQKWQERQIQRVRDAIAIAEKIDDATLREKTVRDLEQQIDGVKEAFDRNELDYGRKLYLIENCIYGVDIQTIAVQIAKMRFFISLIVDQKIDDTQPNRGVRPLPNLETKFVAANTLIGVNRPGQQLLRNRDIDAKEGELRRVRERYFVARTPKQKAKCRDDDARLRGEIAELLKGDGWDTATARKLASWNPYDQNASADFFDPEWMFGITGGFDIVIGNPPYRMLQPHNTDQTELDYLREHYVAADFKIELFHLFLQRGASLLHDSGCLGFIVPSTLLNNVYAEKLRRWLMDHCAIKTIAVSPMHVFAEAEVHTLVVVLNREKDVKNRERNFVATTAELTPQFALSPGEYGRTLQARFAALQGCVWNILLNEHNGALIDKLRKAALPLASVSKINRGLITGDRKRYFSEKKLTEKYVPILTGADVARYSTQPPAEFILFERPDSAGGCWDKDVHLAPHKLVVRQIGTKPMASFLAKPFAVTGNIFTIRGESKMHELFLLGIVNSKLVEFFWKVMFSDFKSSFPQVTIYSLSQVPVIDSRGKSEGHNSAHDRLVALVGKMLMLTPALHTAKTDADRHALENALAKTDRDIDQLVYALYSLTPEEIEIVEESSH